MGSKCTKIRGENLAAKLNTDDEYTKLPSTLQDLVDSSASARQRKNSSIYLKNYWKVLLLIAVFYAVPSIQFVVTLYNERADTKVGVYCYYNYKCSHKILGIDAFNNVISNAGYFLLGALFLLFVRVQDKYDYERPITLGLHQDASLYYALGWAILLEGIFSGLYHLCPSRINFQFDTTFMTIGAALLFVTMHQKRQPTVISGSFRGIVLILFYLINKAYGWLGALILLNVLSLANTSATIFWLFVILITSYVSLMGSLYMYYMDSIRLNRGILERLGYHILHPRLPRQKFKFFCLLIANLMNYALTVTVAVHGFETVATQDFPNFILALITLDFFIYIIYYIIMKYRSGERVYWRVWILFVLMIASWATAIRFYSIAITNKFLTPDESNMLNRPCVLFGFFDDHDIWHFLSSFGLVLFYLVLYFLDMDIANKPCSEISVF